VSLQWRIWESEIPLDPMEMRYTLFGTSSVNKNLWGTGGVQRITLYTLMLTGSE